MRRGLGGSFGYNRAERAEHLMSPRAIVKLLTEVLAKGGHLLLAVGPDATGRIPSMQVSTLERVGAWVRRHDDLVNRSQPWHRWGDGRARYLVLDEALYAIDVDGAGRFAALGREAGYVRSVTRVDPDGFTEIEFEQRADLLTVGHHRHLDRPTATDDVDIAVYRIALEPPPPDPIALFPDIAGAQIDLASVLTDTRPGQIVQLGDGTYLGPARIPDGVTVRGLGPLRTVIDGRESQAVSVGRDAHLEHCTVRGGGNRIVWLPKVAAVLAGPGAVLLGCTVDGHVEIASDDCRVISCTLTGVVAKGVDRVAVSRSTFSGMQLGLRGGDRARQLAPRSRATTSMMSSTRCD